jgi:hypothetical protein
VLRLYLRIDVLVAGRRKARINAQLHKNEALRALREFLFRRVGGWSGQQFERSGFTRAALSTCGRTKAAS